jgi:hypothetical protein
MRERVADGGLYGLAVNDHYIMLPGVSFPCAKGPGSEKGRVTPRYHQCRFLFNIPSHKPEPTNWSLEGFNGPDRDDSGGTLKLSCAEHIAVAAMCSGRCKVDRVEREQKD